MDRNQYQLDNLRKFALTRLTATKAIVDFLESILTNENEDVLYCFHKVTVHNWPDVGKGSLLFDVMMDYFTSPFVPVNYLPTPDTKTFHTSSLSFILKIIKLHFVFPFNRNTYLVNIVFNDKTAFECFNERVTIDNIVNNVVCNRFINNKSELDLSNFCEDPVFKGRRINFYKVGLLANFKLLMLRMGRDTKSLNLSNNNLSIVPMEILNFFIKGDLTEINFSHNNIQSLTELVRVSSKIEKLWVEGNPFCDEMDPHTYVKQIVMKFPRLCELDGINLIQCGTMIPCIKNFLVTPDKKTELVVDTILEQFFKVYDSNNRYHMRLFYVLDAEVSFNIRFTESDKLFSHYADISRNILKPYQLDVNEYDAKRIKSRKTIMWAYCRLPPTTHIPSTFTVDVLIHTPNNLVLVVEGIFKHRFNSSEVYAHFRRTFVFNILSTCTKSKLLVNYYILNEIITISPATKEQIEYCKQVPIRNLSSLELIDPNSSDKDAIFKAFSHITHLKIPEAEARLKNHGFDIKMALQTLVSDIAKNKVSDDMIENEDDEMCDPSSLIDEID